MLFTVAWRNLWRNRTRSLLILLSVAVGMWAGAFIMAIYFGMGNSRLRIAIDKEVSHIQVHHPKFEDDQEAIFNFSENAVRELLQVQPKVKAFSLRSVTSGMLATASGSQGVQVIGIDTAAENATRGFREFMVQGSFFDTIGRKPIIIGHKLSDKLNIPLRGKVVLTLLDTANNMTAGAFRVVGIFETTNARHDEMNAFVLKKDLDQLLGTHGRAHEAALLLENDADLDTVFASLNSKLPELKVETWQEISPETALVVESLETYNLVFMGIILLALSFGIVNTMLMAVLERMREIGVLMALGMSRLRLFGMILFETVLLTIVGAPLGILLTYGTVAIVGRTGINLGAVAEDMMKDFGYDAIIYPELPFDSVVQVLYLVVIAAVLSSIYPAWKAIRLHPVEAIQS